ncbi:MAG: hypothetical protein ABH832_03445 [bacterium]
MPFLYRDLRVGPNRFSFGSQPFIGKEWDPTNPKKLEYEQRCSNILTTARQVIDDVFADVFTLAYSCNWHMDAYDGAMNWYLHFLEGEELNNKYYTMWILRRIVLTRIFETFEKCHAFLSEMEDAVWKKCEELRETHKKTPDTISEEELNKLEKNPFMLLQGSHVRLFHMWFLNLLGPSRIPPSKGYCKEGDREKNESMWSKNAGIDKEKFEEIDDIVHKNENDAIRRSVSCVLDRIDNNESLKSIMKADLDCDIGYKYIGQFIENIMKTLGYMALDMTPEHQLHFAITLLRSWVQMKSHHFVEEEKRTEMCEALMRAADYLDEGRLPLYLAPNLVVSALFAHRQHENVDGDNGEGQKKKDYICNNAAILLLWHKATTWKCDQNELEVELFEAGLINPK